MSKAAKQSIIILILVVVAVLVGGWLIFVEKQKVEQENKSLNSQLTQSQEREKQSIIENQSLKDQIKKTKDEKNQLALQVKDAERQIQNLTGQLDKIGEERTKERAKWEGQVNDVKKERDDLAAQVKSLSEEVTKAKSEQASAAPAPDTKLSSAESSAILSGNEEYWAKILKEKAVLQVELDKVKNDLAKNNGTVIELKQKNSDLQLELDSLQHKTDMAGVETKYRDDLVNNLSLELARSKNEKRFLADKLNQLNVDNEDIRQQLKQLLSSKNALERSVVELSQQKYNLQKELRDTQGLVRNSDDTGDLGYALAQSSSSSIVKSSGEVELPPIIVNAHGNASGFNYGTTRPDLNGKIMSVNEENNFVIVSIGEKSGIQNGDTLSVYRDSKYIARLQVIQVRKEISAADIKEQLAKIQVGDVIR